jgi:hypothetical protein
MTTPIRDADAASQAAGKVELLAVLAVRVDSNVVRALCPEQMHRIGDEVMSVTANGVADAGGGTNAVTRSSNAKFPPPTSSRAATSLVAH